ncbi:MAG: hypothetical protein JSS66_05850 [Armatimonadetes bacterium]|nr:hypothetical protein [Armatimonadota bacterium]
MDAQSILEKYAEKAGWNVDSMLAKACEYIDNQQAADAFEDFVHEAANEEIGMA